MFFYTPGLTAYIYFVTFVFGLVFGSFCNAWAWRIAHREKISKGRSHCTACGHQLNALDLFPLLSYICLKGRCRYCGVPISWRYPAAEVVSAAVFVCVVWKFGLDPVALFVWGGCGCLLFTISLVDIEIYEIPNRLLVALVAIFALGVYPLAGLDGIKNGLIGCFAVSVPLLLLTLLGDKIMGRETMGGGDIKLMAVLGLFFGWAQTLLLLILACFYGIISALIFRKKSKDKVIPFGPSIAVGALSVMLFGNEFIKWYMSLFI